MVAKKSTTSLEVVVGGGAALVDAAGVDWIILGTGGLSRVMKIKNNDNKRLQSGCTEILTFFSFRGFCTETWLLGTSFCSILISLVFDPILLEAWIFEILLKCAGQ